MITDEQIEQIIFGYIQRQDNFNRSIIKIIVERLSKLADFDSIYALDMVNISVSDISSMKKLHKKYIEEQKSHLSTDLWWIVAFLYADAKSYYDSQVALEKNTELYKLTQELVSNAQTSLETLLKNPVFVLRDLSFPNKSKVYDLEHTYQTIMNEAFNYKNVSDELRDIALKRTETQLFERGVRYSINNSSNNENTSVNANNVIRNNVLNSIKETINEVEETMGKQFEADALELSAHIFPAPDHAPAQGHQFSFEEVDKMQSGEDFKDLEGKEYIGFERQIGTWNCRHYFKTIKKGVKPEYSQKQLDKILSDNAKGYTAPNGKHYTLYECTQIQRKYEREIRNSKSKYLYAKMLGDDISASTLRNRTTELTTQYKQFSNACGISINKGRIEVDGYR